MHNILGTHPLFFLFSRFLLKSYIRKICNIYAVAYCIFQLPLYSSPYNFIYTSLAIVAAAGDIAHETDNIDKQVKINRLHTKQYSDPKHQYSRKKWTLFDEKKVRMTKLKPLRNDCRFFLCLVVLKSQMLMTIPRDKHIQHFARLAIMRAHISVSIIPSKLLGMAKGPISPLKKP